MTLQQKIIAKHSKKGFTLVELVVVIAILAILAAIAIPAVVSIINSANTSSGQSDASTLNNACKEFYAGVTSGSINDNNKGSITKSLPSPTASTTARKSAADLLTVKDAQDYSGLAIKTEDMVYVSKKFDSYTVGTILYKEDPAVFKNNSLDTTNVTKINASTPSGANEFGDNLTLGNLYKGTTSTT